MPHGNPLIAEVRAAMARHAVSQAALADALSMSQAAVSRRLSGDVIFTIDELATVARVLHVPLTDFALLAEAGEIAS